MTISTLELVVDGQTYRYESYVSVAEATEYLVVDPELGPGWMELAADDRVRRLVAAARRLDRLPWEGERAAAGQALAWPRGGMSYPDGGAIATTDIPAAVDEAVILLAGDLLVDLSASAGGRQEEVRSMTAGRITESFFYRELSVLENLLPGGTLDLIKYWLKSARPARRATVTGRDKDVGSEFSERYSRENWLSDESSYGSRRRS